MLKMKTGISFLLVALILVCGNISFSAGSKKIGYIKAVGSYGLKEDGSIWRINVFDDTVEKKIGDEFIDIDNSQQKYLGLKKDGSLLSWCDEKDTPILIMKDVKSISAQTALIKDGTVWAWYSSDLSEIDFSTQKPHKVYSGAVSVAFGELIYVLDKKGNMYCIDHSPIDAKLKTYKVSSGVIFITNNYFIKKDKSLYKVLYSRKYDYDKDKAIYRGLDISVKKVLSNVKYADNHVPFGSKEISSTSCAIKEDGSLWLLDIFDSNENYKGNKGIPQKLMTGVKYAKCQNQSISIVKNNGELCEFGDRCPRLSYTIPKAIMKNVKAMYNGDKVLTNDNTLWYLNQNMDKPQKIMDNVKEVLENRAIIKLDGTEYMPYYKPYTDGRIVIKTEIKKSDIKKIKGDCIIKNDNSLWRRSFDQNGVFYKRIDIKIDNVKEIYEDEVQFYILKNDNTLWFAEPDNNISEEDALKTEKYNNPIKILDDVKDVEMYGFNTFAITKDNDMVGWLITPGSKQSFDVKKVMEDIDSFDKKTSTLDIIKEDKSHWSLLANALQFDYASNFVSEVQKNANMDFLNIDNIKYYDDVKYITKDGEYWLRWPALENEYSLKGIPFVKVADNVVYAEEYIDDGIFICKDNSLWAYRNKNSEDLYDYNSIKPVKMMDNVKEVHRQYDIIVALLNDGSLYLWGKENSVFNGQSLENNSKPQYIIGDISKFYFSDNYLFALKNDGTLFSYCLDNEYLTPNPISLVENKDDKIKHYKYEAVGINKDIDIVAEIKDSNYLNNVKVVVDGKEEILLEKSSGNYFTGIIPGLSKQGDISYQIKASNTEGETISTQVYNIEVLSNDCYMIDSEGKEVKIIDTKIFVNGKEICPEVSPVIKSGRTLLELRALATELGADITWNQDSKEIWIQNGNKIVALKIGSREITSNGKKSKIDTPAVVINDRTMLPVRDICNLLGAKITWDQINNKIEISS